MRFINALDGVILLKAGVENNFSKVDKNILLSQTHFKRFYCRIFVHFLKHIIPVEVNKLFCRCMIELRTKIPDGDVISSKPLKTGVDGVVTDGERV